MGGFDGRADLLIVEGLAAPHDVVARCEYFIGAAEQDRLLFRAKRR